MKRYLIFCLMIAACMPTMAQSDGRQGRQHADITEIVSDLNAIQKRRIQTISRESKQRVDQLRAEQQAVRDSIRIFMNREGDQSQTLHPLFDREAKLQAAISREMYATKLRIDEILTREQRAELRAATQKKGPGR